MTAHPIPSEFEARTNATYDALMWALSRPGLSRQLPSADPRAIVETLIDRECQVFCEDRHIEDAALRVGAKLVAPAAADHLFLSKEPLGEVLTSLRQGSDMYPEDGATLILPAQLGAAELGTGQRVQCSGPGVNGTVDVAIAGISPDFWSTRTKLMRYPMGFDLFFLDGDRVLGIPRSTSVEVI